MSQYKLASDWNGQDIKTRYMPPPKPEPQVIETLSSQRRRQEKEVAKESFKKLRNIAFIACIGGLGLIGFSKFFNNSLVDTNTEIPVPAVTAEPADPVPVSEPANHEKGTKQIKNTNHSKKIINKPKTNDSAENTSEKSNTEAQEKQNESHAGDREIYNTMDQFKGLK